MDSSLFHLIGRSMMSLKTSLYFHCHYGCKTVNQSGINSVIANDLSDAVKLLREPDETWAQFHSDC